MKKYLKGLFGKKNEYTADMFAGELGDLQKELTELALQIANENYSIKLDFSHDSIQQVEDILTDIHEQYEKTGNTEGLNGIALEFGFYLAATIQKNTGSGHLERDHPDIGESVFPFYWNDKTIFTYGWFEKRIFDGPGDDVVSKYRVLVLDELDKASNVTP
jgi:hypothetical protein